MSKILVVDDNPTDRKLLAKIVSDLNEDLDVRQFASGKAALKEIRKNTPDLILLDIYLNDRNGLDILKKIKKKGYPPIPVLMISTFSDTDNKMKSLKLGAEDFIDKPIVTEDVRARVMAQLKLKKLLDDEQWGVEEANEGMKTIYKNLEKKNQELQKLDKLKSDFVSSVSHELRTPLTVIKQLISLMYQEIPGPVTNKQREVLVKLQNNTKRLEQIVHNLLDMSRIENRTFRLYYSLMSINNLLRESEEFFKGLAKEKNIDLKYILPKKETDVFVDSEKIIQIVSNLINNAIKFTDANGKIRIGLKISETKVRVGVMDTGIGISKSDLPTVFDKFTQVSPYDGVKNKGIGLGLSITKELVERHHGEIWAESEKGKGSQFYFTLPRFYTLSPLSSRAKKKVEQLLEKNKKVYYISFVVANYEQFQKETDVDLKKSIINLISIIRSTINEFSEENRNMKGPLISDNNKGRYAILASGLSSRRISCFCKLLQGRLKGYFSEHKIKDMFIALGVVTFVSKTDLKEYQKRPSKVKIKEVYVGPQMRRHQRIQYQSKIQIVYPEEAKQTAEIVDLSQSGVCFVSAVPLAIDSLVKVKVKLLRKRELILARARIVWLKKMETSKEKPGQYRVGVEFTHFSNQDRGILKEELDLYYE